MIATHNPKTFNPRLKQSPVIARLDADKLPLHMLHSGNTTGNDLFAAPRNAADMSLARAEAMAKAQATNFETKIPDIEDGKLKQLLLPWQSEYVAITPLPSGKVMQQVHERARMMQEHPRLWAHMRLIQPVPAAANNHGDPIAAKAGRVLLVEQRTFPVAAQDVDSTFGVHGVLLTADITGLQISSNYVQVGMPAITAVGGAVHVIERETGLSLPFAVSIDPFDRWNDGKMGGRRALDGSAVKDVVLDEITANTRILLLLECAPYDHAIVKNALQKLTRIAGGTLWNHTLSSIAPDTVQPPRRWIMPGTVIPRDGRDMLESCLFLRRTEPADRALTQAGYAFLHEPRTQAMARNNGGLHAWAEPMFNMCRLQMLDAGGFWRYKQNTAGCWWE